MAVQTGSRAIFGENDDRVGQAGWAQAFWAPPAWLQRVRALTRRDWGRAGATPSAVAGAERLVAAINSQQGKSVERLLAVARAVIATVLVGVLLPSATPAHFELAHWASAAYSAYALAVLLAVWSRPPLRTATCEALHYADLGWTTALAALSGGTSSHAYPLFAFVLIASGYRWGLKRTLLDGLAALGISFVLAAVSLAGLTPWPFELDHFLIRMSSIVVIAILLGVLSGGQRALRFQALAVGGLLGRLTENTLAAPAVRDLLGEMLEIFGATSVALVIHDHDETAPLLWATKKDANGRRVFSKKPLSPVEQTALVHAPATTVGAFEARRSVGRRGRGHAAISEPQTTVTDVVLAVGPDGARTDPAAVVLPDVAWDTSWTTMIATVAPVSPRWVARLFVFDPDLRPRGDVRLAFLLNLGRAIGPPLLNIHLFAKLRARAESDERGRIARELHDGAIQSLLALEMRLDLLRRRAEGTDLVDEIGELQGVTRAANAELRDFSLELNPPKVDTTGLRPALSDLVRRFQRPGGPEVELQWAVGRVELGNRQAFDTYRLVQEALVNVRRHSGATRVRVRIEADADEARVIVEDNGKGMGFVGRRTHDQLAAEHAGPRVLRERVGRMGGQLTAESSRAGTRLELVFPHDAPA